jgi:Arc/MetJ-type ribon-helix-helix transcriptional regulator
MDTFKILVAVPKSMLTEIDEMCKFESRTRSDFIREASRRMLANHQRQKALNIQSCEPPKIVALRQSPDVMTFPEPVYSGPINF